MRVIGALWGKLNEATNALVATFLFMLLGISLVTVVVKFIAGSFWAAWITGCSLSFLGLACLYQPSLLIGIGVIGDLLEGLGLIDEDRGAIEGIGSLPFVEYFTMAIRLAVFSMTALSLLALFPQSGWSFVAYFVVIILIFHILANDPLLKASIKTAWWINVGQCLLLLAVLVFNASPQLQVLVPFGDLTGFFPDKELSEVVSRGRRAEAEAHRQQVLADLYEVQRKVVEGEELSTEETGYWKATKAGRKWTREEYRQYQNQRWRLIPFWVVVAVLLITIIFFWWVITRRRRWQRGGGALPASASSSNKRVLLFLLVLVLVVTAFFFWTGNDRGEFFPSWRNWGISPLMRTSTDSSGVLSLGSGGRILLENPLEVPPGFGFEKGVKVMFSNGVAIGRYTNQSNHSVEVVGLSTRREEGVGEDAEVKVKLPQRNEWISYRQVSTWRWLARRFFGF